MVTEGEILKEENSRTKHVEDATSLVLMSKRDIYEKLINCRSKGEMRLISSNCKGSEEESSRSY